MNKILRDEKVKLRYTVRLRYKMNINVIYNTYIIYYVPFFINSYFFRLPKPKMYVMTAFQVWKYVFISPGCQNRFVGLLCQKWRLCRLLMSKVTVLQASCVKRCSSQLRIKKAILSAQETQNTIFNL